jgi:hypothetical protein
MGRYYFTSKTTVEKAIQLNIFKLKEFDLLRDCAAINLIWTRRLSGQQSSIGISVDIAVNRESISQANY